MRKSSKLLAVLLTLCLLFGAITAIFASADGEAKDPFNVTGHSANDYLAETTTAYNVKGVSAAKYDSTREIKNLSYITLDFDITFTGNPTATDTGRIRILNKVSYYDEEGTAKGHNKTGGGLYIYWNNGNPGIGSTTGIATNGDLNCVNGEYDHITVVMKPKAKASTTNNLDGYQLTQSVYINGIQTGYKIAEAPNNEKNVLGVNAMYNGFGLEDVTNSGTVNIKNIAVNHYTANDASLAKCDTYSDVTPLYDIDGLVYNANYVTGNENKYVELSTGEKFFVPAGAAIGAKITNGATVTVKGLNVKNVDVAEGVTSFTVVEDGGTFELSEASTAGFEKNGNLYTKKLLSYADDTINGLTGTQNLGNGKTPTTTTTLGWAYNNTAKSQGINATHFENSYTRIHYQAGALKAATNPDGSFTLQSNQNREAEVAWRAHSTYNEVYELSTKKYMTLDFDFGADANVYTFTVGEGETAQTYYATAMTEEEAVAKVNAEWGEGTLTAGNYTLAGCDLALPTASDGKITFRLQFVVAYRPGATTLSSLPVASNVNWYWDATEVSVQKGDDGWYLVSGENKAKLSSEAGVFDHITFVCEVTQTTKTIEGVECNDVTVIVPHVYVNGEYVFDASSTKGWFNDNYKPNNTETDPAKIGDKKDHDAVYHQFQQFMVQFGAKKDAGVPGYKMYDKYSLAFDNMTLTYYDEGDLYNTTLDENNAEKAPLYTLEGVVYNEDYVTPNTDKYALLTEGGNEKKYYVIGAAVNKLSAGDTLKLYNAKVDGFVTTDDGFDVICNGTAEFKFDSSCGWRYAKNGNTYVRVIDGTVMGNVSLSSNEFRFNLYFPINKNLPADCISIDAVYSNASLTKKDTNFKASYNFKYTYNDVNYYAVSWYARTDMTTAKNGHVLLKYNNGEEAIKLEGALLATFDPIAYMRTVATDAECGSEVAKLVHAMMDYKVAVINYLEGESYDAASSVTTIKRFYEIFAGHGTDCTCATHEPEDKNSAPEDKYITVGTKHGTITLPEGIKFGYGADSSKYRFYIYLYGPAKTVFEVKYTDAEGHEQTATSTSGAVGSSGYAVANVPTTLKMIDIDNDLKITAYKGVEGEDGEVTKGEVIGSFEFSIYDFTDEVGTPAGNVIDAIKKLAIEAENYKKYVKNPTPAN